MSEWRSLDFSEPEPAKKIPGVINQTGFIAYGLDAKEHWFTDEIVRSVRQQGALYVAGGKHRFDSVVFNSPRITTNQVAPTMTRLWYQHHQDCE